MNDKLTYEWREEDGGKRPDRILAERLRCSRTQLQRWMKAGLVSAAGKPLEVTGRLHPGDLIEIRPPAPEPEQAVEAEEIPLRILHEDRDVVVIDKAAGMTVHPGAGIRQGTLVSALLAHCRGELSGIGGVERPGIVHRLDRETSGVLVVAKNDLAHRSLSDQFKNRETRKCYRAWVAGEMRMPSGTWGGAIGRHPVQRKKMAVRREGGRESRTDFRVLEHHPRATLLELQLHTGRTHQIRVHCSAAGFPVVGDALYGRRPGWLDATVVTRQLLHAWKLSFRHPRSQKTIEITAPMPEDFEAFRVFLNP